MRANFYTRTISIYTPLHLYHLWIVVPLAFLPLVFRRSDMPILAGISSLPAFTIKVVLTRGHELSRVLSWMGVTTRPSSLADFMEKIVTDIT